MAGENAAGGVLETSQQAAYKQLTEDLVKKVEQHGNELSENFTRELKANAGEIATLSNNFKDVQAKYAERFKALASQQQRGSLRHGFQSDEVARDFGRAIVAMKNRDGDTLKELQKAAMLPTIGSQGGWLLPEIIIADIMRELDQYGVFLADCPPIGVNGLKGGSPRGTSGFGLYHPDYGKAGTVSTPGIGSTAWELLRYVVAGEIEQWMMASELNIALAEYIRQEIAYALEYGTDAEWFMGTGTEAYGKYTGLFKLTGSATVSATLPTVVTGVSGDDTFAELIAKTTYYLTQVMGMLPEWAHRAGPSWYMHPFIYFSYFGVRDSGGMPIPGVFVGEGPQLRLCGLPVRLVCGAPSATAVSTVFLLLTCLKRACRTYRHNKAVEIAWSDNLGEDKWLAGISGVKCDVPMDMRVRVPSGIVQLATAAS